MDDENRTTFTAHEDVLCNRASLFRTACKDDSSGLEHATIEVPGIAPLHFQVYLDWAYANGNDLRSAVAELYEVRDTKAKWMPNTGYIVVIWSSLWYLGQMIGDHHFSDEAMGGLLDVDAASVKAFMDCEGAVKIMLRHTTPASGLQRWLVDAVAILIDEQSIEAMGNKRPPDFTLAVLKKLVGLRKDTASESLPTFNDIQKYKVQDGDSIE